MISALCGSMSLSGRRREPTSKPIMLSAAFAGIGFTSQKSASHNGMQSICIFVAFLISPLRYDVIMSCTYFGTILERTDTTPLPPRDNIGIIWSSLPEY